MNDLEMDNKPKRSRTGTIVAILVGLGVLGCLGTIACAAGIVGTVFTAMRQTEPYQVAVERATTDPAVIEALGAPVETGFLFTGSVEQDMNGGTAVLEIPLEGSRTSGTLYVDAEQQGGVWTYYTMEVVVSGGSRVIDLRER